MNRLDGPWKDVMEPLFQSMMAMLFPDIYKMIDWSKPRRFCEKELKTLTRRMSRKGRRFVDKLVEVTLKDGQRGLLLIHIEVQNAHDPHFPRRMYVYHYRLFDLRGEQIYSLAILGDKNPSWRPKKYVYGLPRNRTVFNFPMVKLMDYRKRWSQLERSNNPFALVIMAHMEAIRTQKSTRQRAVAKFSIMRRAIIKQYDRDQIHAIFDFIDQVLTVPEVLDKQIDLQLNEELGVKKMAYVNMFLRPYFQEGKKEGKKEERRSILLELLEAKFGKVPSHILEKIDNASLSDLKTWISASIQKSTFEEVFS